VPGTLEKAIEIVLGGAAQAKEGFGVGQPMAGVDDGAGKAGGAGLAISVQANEGGVGETLFIGAEGAEAV